MYVHKSNEIVIKISNDKDVDKIVKNALLTFVRTDSDGKVFMGDFNNCYRGDDETIVYGVMFYLGDNNIHDFKILWEESSY